jgi:hypothetical protein
VKSLLSMKSFGIAMFFSPLLSILLVAIAHALRWLCRRPACRTPASPVSDYNLSRPSQKSEFIPN